MNPLDGDGPLRKAKQLDHVLRTPLPWRDPGDNRTECGRPVEDTASVITRDELVARLRDMGAQRAALFTCYTCADRARYTGSWDELPLAVLSREIARVGEHAPYGPRGDDHRRLVSEMHAVGALIEAHRDEFDGYVNGVTETVSLADQRAKRATREAANRSGWRR